MIWAKDEGTYLFSNGLPRQVAGIDVPVVVYACGYGPGTGDHGSTALGEFDFAEYIALTDRDAQGQTLVQQIREFAETDGWMIITAAPGTYRVALSTQRPPTCSRPTGHGVRAPRTPRIFTWLPHRRQHRRDM
ncbi:hypothetical protein ACWEKT_40345 [Nocardia takedensis]